MSLVIGRDPAADSPVTALGADRGNLRPIRSWVLWAHGEAAPRGAGYGVQVTTAASEKGLPVDEGSAHTGKFKFPLLPDPPGFFPPPGPFPIGAESQFGVRDSMEQLP